jgi:hypothetical protein
MSRLELWRQLQDFREDLRVELATLGYVDRAVPFYERRRNPFVRTEKCPLVFTGSGGWLSLRAFVASASAPP